MVDIGLSHPEPRSGLEYCIQYHICDLVTAFFRVNVFAKEDTQHNMCGADLESGYRLKLTKSKIELIGFDGEVVCNERSDDIHSLSRLVGKYTDFIINRWVFEEE